MRACGLRSLSMLAAASLLFANGPAKAATFNFSIGPNAVGTFTTFNGGSADPGYDLITTLTFDRLSGTEESGTPFSFTNVEATTFQVGAAFNPTTHAFVNHFLGDTFHDIGNFDLSNGVAIVGSPFGEPTPLEGVVNGTTFSVNGRLVITPVVGNVGAPPPATPLPAAFPLFATGLGALGLLSWHRKRKAGVGLLGAA
jgi:hypothetical protein